MPEVPGCGCGAIRGGRNAERGGVGAGVPVLFVFPFLLRLVFIVWDNYMT